MTNGTAYDDDTVRQFAESLEAHESWHAARSEQNFQMYSVLKSNGELRRTELARFYCKRGCLVATVFRALDRTLIHLPSYKIPRKYVEEESSPSARAVNTYDGEEWRERVLELDDRTSTYEVIGIDPRCSHLHNRFMSFAEISRIIEGVTPGQPILQRVLARPNDS